jgi:hypothetical protein
MVGCVNLGFWESIPCRERHLRVINTEWISEATEQCESCSKWTEKEERTDPWRKQQPESWGKLKSVSGNNQMLLRRKMKITN